MSTSIEAFRGFYARRIAAMAGTPQVEDRLVRAFEAVPREQFLEKGPWNVFTGAGYIRTPTDDPAFLYQDIVVALSGDGPANNGQPSLHATCLGHVNPMPGETVLHIGAGSGYYTAILAMLVGPTGTVVAYEIQKSLAEWAAGNLAAYSNVTVRNRSGSTGPLPYADVVYVSAGATAPLGIWLDALQAGGRLMFPLTAADGVGAMLLLTKKSADRFAAAFVSPAMFIPCSGGRDDATAQRLIDAFRRGGTEAVSSLYRTKPVDDSCWFAGDGWWLSTF
jgi:protein-L-isoaspartate(D-aspartate) O-methyltransferase